MLNNAKLFALSLSTSIATGSGSSSSDSSNTSENIAGSYGTTQGSLTFKTLALLAGTTMLSACDPAFETTAQRCAAGQELEIVIPVPDPKFETLAGTDEYELYLSETLEVMAPSITLTGEDLDAKTFIDTQIDNFLEYQRSGASVTGAQNPVDFLEGIIATTDPDIEIEAFVLAKELLASSLAADDDFCIYTNDNIRLVDTDASATDLAFAEVSFSYNPFSRIVQQSVIVAEQRSDLDSTEGRESASFVGFFQALPENYQSVGFTSPEVRQLISNDEQGFASLSFDTGEDTELGQILIDYNNEYCDQDRTSDEPADWADCPAGTVTRVPSTAIAGGVCDDEANKLAENSFDLNASNTNLKRLRVEVDFTTDKAGEVRFYASEYQEAIFASDGTTVILDPTDCEKQAVLDELFEAGDGSGVRLTFVPDPGYDITFQTDANGDPILDSDGNQIVDAEPMPAVVYQGTSASIRP